MMTQKDDISKILKNSLFQLVISLLVLGFIYHFAKTSESAYMRAKRLDFPGITELTLNGSFQRFEFKKDPSQLPFDLIKSLNDKKLEVVSAVYADYKKNIRIVVTRSADAVLLLTLIKNNQVTRVQRINEINQRKITLQYGSMQLNSNLLAEATESNEIL
jgi:hypothetical protein